MLNPLGGRNFAVGSLSSAVGIGGGATGANLAAAALVSGRPMSGEPGGRAGCAAGAAAGGGPPVFGDCWAAAPATSMLPKAPASKMPRRSDEPVAIMSSLHFETGFYQFGPVFRFSSFRFSQSTRNWH
jgi:hypothetical protein